MRFKSSIISLFCIALLIRPAGVFAFETDQYNLPDKPLADIGIEVNDYAVRNISEASEKINNQIREIESCPRNEDCRLSRKDLEKLADLRSEDAIAKAVFKEMGDGIIPFTKSGWWLEGYKFKEPNSRYKTSFQDSIYLTAPFNFATVSSTIKMYDTEFGTDKIAHLFQQGYDYYKIYKREISRGATKEKAIKKAVKWGKKTERTYFGTWVSGVYSNGDLAANYAGLKFYIGLTEEIKIGELARPAVLNLKNGLWAFNEKADLSESLLKPFISKHLNEAYNPSRYFNALNFRKYIRRVVRKQSCRQWFDRFPELKRSELEETTRSLEDWHGDDYGFTPDKHFITIANTCFDNDAPRKDTNLSNKFGI